MGLSLANYFWIAPLTSNHPRPGAIAAGGKHPVAPDFSLKDINGQTIHLADYRGKVLMIDFWATDCGPCRTEIPGFVQLQERYRDQGFMIVGISLDSGPEPVRDFYKEFKMNYAVALDSGDLDERFGVTLGVPTTFLVGRDGRIYAKHVGAQDTSVFEQEIKSLLAANSQTELTAPRPTVAQIADAMGVTNPIVETVTR
ncbi:MAG TPA: TlpA disulfide reductase family protein [Terriglobia bacterium]|nr:TlpA disulfide reductase family protein [Terriglobia bacterium]